VRIGIGLPTSTPGATGEQLRRLGTRAEDGPFTSLGVVDRVAYDSFDPLVSLAAAAGVTSGSARARWSSSVRSGGPLIREAGGDGRRALRRPARARRVHRRPAGGLRGRRARNGRGGAVSGCPISSPSCATSGRTRPRSASQARRGGPVLVGGIGAPVPPRRTLTRRLRPRRRTTAGVRRRRPTRPGPPGSRPDARRARAVGAVVLRAHRPAAGEAYMRDYYAFTGTFAERIVAGLLTSPSGDARAGPRVRRRGCDELVLLPATSIPASSTGSPT
jgi:hypothetical protein